MEGVGDFLVVLFGSGAGVALATVGIEQWRHSKSRQESVRHLALRVAFMLEGYAIDCADKVEFADVDRVRDFSAVPQLPALPESSAYVLMQTDILEKILDHPQQCQMAGSGAAFLREIGDPESASVAVEEATIQLGQKALEIAQEIRKHYHLPRRKLVSGTWDIETFYARECSRVREQEARRAEERTGFSC